MIIIKNSNENEGKGNNKKLKIQFNPGVLSE